MTFASVNTWAYNDELTFTQINTINTNLTNAVDGLGGGTYTPTAALIIAGSNGFKATGRFEVTSSALMTGGFITSGSVQFGAATQITSGNTFTLAAGSFLSAANTANITLVAGSTFYSNTELTMKAGFGSVYWETGTVGTFASGSTLLLANGSTVTGIAGSTVNLAGTNTLSGTNTISGATSLTAKMTASGSGRVVRRRVSVSDADHLNYTIADGDLFHCTAILTANRNLQFLNTGAVAGDVIDISIVGSGGTANTVTIKDNGGGTITTLQNTVTNHQSTTLIYNGSNWVEFSYTIRG